MDAYIGNEGLCADDLAPFLREAAAHRRSCGAIDCLRHRRVHRHFSRSLTSPTDIAAFATFPATPRFPAPSKAHVDCAPSWQPSLRTTVDRAPEKALTASHDTQPSARRAPSTTFFGPDARHSEPRTHWQVSLTDRVAQPGPA